MPRRVVVLLLVLTGLIGCSSEPEAKPLSAEQFVRPGPFERDRDRAGDRGGAIIATATPGNGTNADAPAPAVQPVKVENTSDALDLVKSEVKSPPSTTLPAGGAAPTKVQPAFAVGQYVSVGAIIAEVNGTPIYADDVLRAIAPLLAGRAKDLEAGSFQGVAANEIGRQVELMINNEVVYASADRNLSAEDKKLADHLTEQWRDKLKTENKGSIEEVRRRLREQGTTYDQAAKDQYRINLIRVFYLKKLVPRIQITANDIRRYYDEKLDTEFTQHDAITFRLIKITAAATGSDAAARAKVEALAARAQRGEDFAKMAAETNDDAALLRKAGEVGPIDRGAYRLEEVENALWPLNPGQTTPVLSVKGDYYLAQLTTKKLGRVQAFDEDVVQKKVYDVLRAQQLGRMQRDFEAKLVRESVVSKNQQTYATTLAMAMQNYPRWHADKDG